MGARHCVNIGPYMVLGEIPKISTTSTKTKINKVNTCSDVECKSHKKALTGNFCQLCGSATTELVWESTSTNTVVKTTSSYDLMEEFGNEGLFFNLDELMIPNSSEKELKKYMISAGQDDDSFEKEIPNKEEAIICFEKTYEKFLAFLTEKKVPYEVKFGVISYWW
jgi:hypothetical protein